MATKYKAQQMIDAIQASRGVLAAAARKLGCSRQTVYNYMKRYATVKDAYEEANETNIDYVENKLMKQIDNDVLTAIIFFLKTKGKHRGWVERWEHTGADGDALEINVTVDDAS